MKEGTTDIKELLNVIETQKNALQEKDQELKVHAALEKIRASTMAMKKEDDLLAIADLMLEQIQELGVDAEVANFSDGLSYGDWDLWITGPSSDKTRRTVRRRVPFIKHPYFHKTHEGLDNFYKNGKDLNVALFNKQEKDSFLDHLFSCGFFDDAPKQAGGYVYAKPGFTFSAILMEETWVSIGKYDDSFFTDDENNLLRRFAHAFGQAYKRFLDIQGLEIALNELKAAQAQLIQSEKMASLGELTAGIAHEIQNPLNFVNNFSELNAELALELREELEQSNWEAAAELSKIIIANEDKIHHHGRRAESIVRSMLQHARKEVGKKQRTDINELAGEFSRLAYHGFRSRDKSFNAKLEIDLDPDLPEIEVMPQDLGRVFLNLVNNALYAVDQKRMKAIDYSPAVSVTTKASTGSVEITIRDNGNGIPADIVDKIFQPFFTTKPAGQGTGVGLSLSYDVIKAHGGEIKIDTMEGEYAAFIINLPA